MPKVKISEFSSTPANNTDIDSINIAEGCAPSGINDAIRELMAQLKDFQTGAVGDSFNGPVGTTTAAAGAFTTLSASGAATLSGLTASTALALDGSKNIVSVTNTGTGSNVLATSPTLVTPALGTPSALVGTNITGTATSFNINGTVGATTPASGAFTTLAASGAVTLSGGTANGVAFLNGSKVVTSGSALTFDGTNFNVIRSAATDQYMSLFADGTGPTFKFFGGAAGKTAGITADSASSSMYFTNEGNKPFVYAINGSEQMRLTSTGLGIGTSSPASKLDVIAANVALASNGIQRIGADSSGADIGGQITFSNTNARRAAIAGRQESTDAIAGYLQFGTRGTAGDITERMRIDSSGNLGLGVTPSASWAGGYTAFQMQNVGRSLAATGSGSGDITLAFNAVYDNTDARWEYAYTGDKAGRYSQTGAGDHVFYVTNTTGTAGNAITFTQAMTLDASGNLGVGTTSINTRLHIVGLNQTNGTAEFTPNASKGSNASYVHYGTNGDWYIRSASSSGNVYIQDTGGNVGIATTTPSQKLDVVTNSNSGTAVQLSLRNTSNGTNVSAGIAFGFNSVAADPDVLATIYGLVTDRTTRNGALTFSTAASGTLSERARIDSSGNLLVGTTTNFNSDPNWRQTIESSLHCLGLKTTASTSYVNQSNWHASTSGNPTFIEFATETTFTARGSITYNRAGGLTAYNTTSDYRAKEISGPVIGSGALIDSTPVYMGKMKGATQERPMFIAHETPAYAHTGEKDAVDADGNPVYQQMDASALIPVMWAEIQSLRKRLADAGL